MFDLTHKEKFSKARDAITLIVDKLCSFIERS